MEESKKIKDKKRRENSQGITLIALVITIIVLLILAGVSFAMLTGEDGILTQAQNASEKTSKAEEEEKMRMAVMGSSVDNNGYVDVLDETSFKQELANQFGNQSLDVVANGDGSFIITVEETQRKYYVNDDKTVINSDNIVEISNAEELMAFRDDVNSGNSYEGKAVLLTDDIILSENWTPIGIISPDTDNKNPETEDNKPFKGIFDGGRHTINNLNISSTENKYNGLFSFVVDGTIRNVTIGENSEITGIDGAGVVGYLYGFEGNIYNCINYADSVGAGIVSALAGQHTVSNCKNYGTINGSGGIVGGSNGIDWEQFTNVSNKIINCGNYGNVTKTSGRGTCGGIVGYFKGDIYNCCNNGEINNNGRYTGGIVATADNAKIENCYNTGNVSGQFETGGILGAPNSTEVNGINCYSTGEITGTERVGNIFGWEENEEMQNHIFNCYTKNDTFTAADLGDAFKEDTENVNGGYPLLYWE